MKIIKHIPQILAVLLLTPVFLFSQSDSQKLELRAEPEYFSPNGDGIQDHTFFSPYLLVDQDITRWRMVIRNGKRKKARRMTGPNFSALIKWDGMNKKGNPVPDGEYFAVLTVYGKKLELDSYPKRIMVDVSPPLVELAISTPVLDPGIPGQDMLDFQVAMEDESAIDRWQMQVLDVTGRTVYVEWSTHAVTSVYWDGTDSTTGVFVPQGIYRCAFQAWDRAGNESHPAFVDVEVNVTAREMLERVLNNIQVVVTDLGLIVQLEAEDLFSYEKRKHVLRPEAEELLKEVALLINAYPDADIRLDGYSWKYKKAQNDRKKSSFYAWNVYSYLVKKGNVVPSRLTVKGRGRSAMFERRNVDLPVMKNGVEVILNGDRDW